MNKDGKEPGAPNRPFADDPAETIIRDPVDGVVTSEEFKHTKERADAPFEDGGAARWQEHAYDVQAGEAGKAWDDNVCVELARFTAPPGTQGRVSTLETAAILIPPEHGPPYSCACLFPWYYDYLNSFLTTSSLSFHLRLESYKRQGLEPGPVTIADVNALPGTPHPSLGSWNDARYDFGRAKYQPLSLFVPEGQHLRLFAEFGFNPRDLIDRLWGRLGGITQHHRGNVEALKASRAWPG